MSELTWVELVIPAASGVLGASIGLFGTIFAQGRANAGTIHREQIAREAAREAAAIAARRAFEIETFSRLPELIHAHARMTMRILLADEEALIASGKLADDPPAGGEQGFEVAVELMLVTNRVIDDAVREELARARQDMTALGITAQPAGPLSVDRIRSDYLQKTSQLIRLADDAIGLVAEGQRALYMA
ncbi:hypothetical protein [Curtobacterium flaccumfaciens]|uniref:hypothetical protein n=1 Tax=Curtobacterium flaccumfaciens TaxID=2035 RepID=UPI003D9A8BE5